MTILLGSAAPAPVALGCRHGGSAPPGCLPTSPARRRQAAANHGPVDSARRDRPPVDDRPTPGAPC